MIKSEDQVLALLDEYFPREHSKVHLGRGDDCAEITPVAPLAVSTDLFIDEVHFRRSYFLPEEIGHKALAVNLSDLASSGAIPGVFSLGLTIPPDMESDELAKIFSGMAALAARHDMALIGGDISRAGCLSFCITVMGIPSTIGSPFLRRDPEPDEFIFVLSPGKRCRLGLARNGLQRLEAGWRSAMEAAPESCRALLMPEPLVVAGQALAKAACESSLHLAMMDLSDGLARDLPRFVGPYGAELDFEPSILHPELGEHALELALSGGDDYLLLGSASEKAIKVLSAVRSGCSLQVIGRVSGGPGVFYRGRELFEFGAKAFDHFEE